MTANELNSLGEGTINIETSFKRNADNAVSNTGTNSFVFDKTLPDLPTTANTDAADQKNYVSELAGGLTRPRQNRTDTTANNAADKQDSSLITEASKSITLYVPLPANIKEGDSLTLVWGDNNHTLSQLTVVKSEVRLGYKAVVIDPAFISAYGDSADLSVKAYVTDSANNPGPLYQVWSGPVDAAPETPDVNITFGEWLNNAEAHTWGLNGSGERGGTIELLFKGRLNQILKKDIAINSSTGLWSYNSLTLTDAQTLGDGPVTVTVFQRDANGNPSASRDLSFQIDTTPPDGPGLDTVAAYITYAQTQNGTTFSGTTFESQAKLSVVFKRNADGSTVNTLANKPVTVNGNTWSVQLSAEDFAVLNGNRGTGDVTMTVTQTDQALNSSVPADRTFTYADRPLVVPALTSVTGLVFDAVNPHDNNINLQDIRGSAVNPHDNNINLQDIRDSGGTLTITGNMGAGTRPSNQRIHLILKMTDLPPKDFYVDNADINSNGTWTKTLTAQEVNNLGQGMGSLKVSTQEYQTSNGQQVITNESLPASTDFNIDTVVPSITNVIVKGSGLNQNAKVNDTVDIQLDTTEPVVVTGTPQVLLQGFSDGLTRIATYDASKSSQAGSMVFSYTVTTGDNVPKGRISLVANSLTGGTIKDKVGNPLDTSVIPSVLTNTVIVDTVNPVQPTVSSVDASQLSSTAGITINQTEANAGVRVRLNLPTTSNPAESAAQGDTVQLYWDTNMVTQVLTSADITNGYVNITVSAQTIGQVEGTAPNSSSPKSPTAVDVYAILKDASGNPSVNTSSSTVQVDTKPPKKLLIDTWMSDDKINAAEKDSLDNLTGSKLEIGATLRAAVIQGNLQFDIDASNIVTNTDGTWYIKASALQTISNTNLSEGKFSIKVWQTDSHANEGAATVQDYYKDVTAVNTPPSFVIPAANGDDPATNWINRQEASNLQLQISLTGTGANTGDVLLISGWTSGESWRYTITDSDRQNGFVVYKPDAALLLQASNAAPRTNMKLQVQLEDQGANTSGTRDSKVFSLDTNISTPVIDTTEGVTRGVDVAQSTDNL